MRPAMAEASALTFDSVVTSAAENPDGGLVPANALVTLTRYASSVAASTNAAPSVSFGSAERYDSFARCNIIEHCAALVPDASWSYETMASAGGFDDGETPVLPVCPASPSKPEAYGMPKFAIRPPGPPAPGCPAAPPAPPAPPLLVAVSCDDDGATAYETLIVPAAPPVPPVPPAPPVPPCPPRPG